ncbi:lytic transglycosylase domain-containing protein [Martelella alba]|nr:lytic transglycosylase domain-containing protein [Martelella alba]
MRHKRKIAAVAMLLMTGTGNALAAGIPVFDRALVNQESDILDALNADLTTQDQKRSRAGQLLDLDADIIKELDRLIDAGSVPAESTEKTIDTLEKGAGEDKAAVSQLYNPDDTNPAAAQTFGDAAPTVEDVIIAGAKATYGNAGVSAAGLSQAQWRALLQALIWQESRFNAHVTSPVGAYGLTQLMPGTASDMGVNPAYRTDPNAQVRGGANYLGNMLIMFNGNVVHGLAAYNAGPGNVRKHNGVPPFKETQHYVQVIPKKYNEYLALIGGIDATGTIDPVLASSANFSMSSDNAMAYGANLNAEIAAIAYRVKAIMIQMENNTNPAKAWVINTYARAEMERIMVLRLRLLAAQTKQVSADALQQAALRAGERAYMTFSNQ